jgi:polysaccharide deacetylase family protein (PEP-CTERM system associated)
MLNFETSTLHYGSTAAQGDFASNLKRPACPKPFGEGRSAPLTSSKFIEFPLSTVRICGQNFPISGGGYFRLLPYPLIKKGLRRINDEEERPFIFYIHPWEIDPDQPRLNSISFRSRFRHYVNLHKTESRFKKLLSDFRFSAISDLLNGSTATQQHFSNP